jgi:hypothetical protein
MDFNDFYFNLMLQANDEDLLNLCQLNHATKDICQSVYFWKQKQLHKNIKPVESELYQDQMINYFYSQF